MSNHLAPAFRVCGTSPATTININSACRPLSKSNDSPIDQYYDAAEAITIVGDPGLLHTHPVLGRLLLLGHTSAAESYVRGIIAGLLNICSVAKRHAGTHAIPFASLEYYSPSEMAYGLFEGKSLAGSQELLQAIKKLTGIEIKPGSAAFVAIEKFDSVCHLRHAAVHAHGSIGTANVRALGLSSGGGRMSVDIDLPRLHEVAMTCRTMAQEMNQFLFDSTLERWKNGGILARDYNLDRGNFRKLLQLFLSDRDNASGKFGPKKIYDHLV
ncbi:hypothetical protein [Actinokineospora spheciospongiae]|uniref:hypothetical protein n=1 Tax=Actinokineospora spheciospongiae TaxID=909613 RepID=UPI0012687BE8|nr:hypothetical protein [Actinokineospora spheciospongiae]